MGRLDKIRDIHPGMNILRTLTHWNTLQKKRYRSSSGNNGSGGYINTDTHYTTGNSSSQGINIFPVDQTSHAYQSPGGTCDILINRVNTARGQGGQGGRQCYSAYTEAESSGDRGGGGVVVIMEYFDPLP